jgi:hypothetical protein
MITWDDDNFGQFISIGWDFEVYPFTSGGGGLIPDEQVNIQIGYIVPGAIGGM